MMLTADMTRNYFRFIYERQLIWYRRAVLRLPPPWTDDEIMQKYKIINMYRQLDRCTIYLLKRLEGVSGRKALLFNIIFFRFFNADQLYENLGVEPFVAYDTFTARASLQNGSTR